MGIRTFAALLLVTLMVAGTAETAGRAEYVIDVPNRQYMEAVRDALYAYEVANTPNLGATHPMMVFIRELRQDIAVKFVGRRAGEEW